MLFRSGFGSQRFDRRVVDEMRSGVVMAATPVARDVARQNDQHAHGIIGQPDQQPRLWQIQETEEGFLDTVQSIVGPHTFPPHHASEARPMPMHEIGDPAVKTVRTIRSIARS